MLWIKHVAQKVNRGIAQIELAPKRSFWLTVGQGASYVGMMSPLRRKLVRMDP